MALRVRCAMPGTDVPYAQLTPAPCKRSGEEIRQIVFSCLIWPCMRCPGLPNAMVIRGIRTCYAMSGTGIRYHDAGHTPVLCSVRY
eukprot:1655440-Rhodomonas_salina.2